MATANEELRRLINRRRPASSVPSKPTTPVHNVSGAAGGPDASRWGSLMQNFWSQPTRRGPQLDGQLAKEPDPNILTHPQPDVVLSRQDLNPIAIHDVVNGVREDLFSFEQDLLDLNSAASGEPYNGQYDSPPLGLEETTPMELDFEMPDFNMEGLAFDDATGDHMLLDNSSIIEQDSVHQVPARRQRSQISTANNAILMEWLSDNSPYPRMADKAWLSKTTGLSIPQISSWFSRARQRKLKRVVVPSTQPARESEQIESTTNGSIQNEGMLAKLLRLSRPAPACESHLQSSTQPLLSVLVDDWCRPTQLAQSNFGAPMIYRKPPGDGSNIRRSKSQPALVYNSRELRPVRHTQSESSQTRLSLFVGATSVNDTCANNSLGGIQRPPSAFGLIMKFSFGETVRDRVVAWLDKVTEPAGPDPEPTMNSPTTDGHPPTERYAQSSEIALPEYTLPMSETDSFSLKSSVRDDQLDDGFFASLISLPPSTSSPIPFDATSNPGSSVSSVHSVASPASYASSYVSFGSRKGRRMVFQQGHRTPSRAGSLTGSNSFAKTNTDVELNRNPWDDNLSFPSMGHPGRMKKSLEHPEEQALKRTASVPCLNPEPPRTHKRRPEIVKAWTLEAPLPTKYWCTFCQCVFSRASTWKRHEESTHSPQKVWICKPHPLPLATHVSCPLCAAAQLPPSVACEHDFDNCWKKPRSDRCFYRKDSLKQHIGLKHGKTCKDLVDMLDLDSWAEAATKTDLDLTCHFCGYPSTTWDERAKHIAQHFRSGTTMDMWMPNGPYMLFNTGQHPLNNLPVAMHGSGFTNFNFGLGNLDANGSSPMQLDVEESPGLIPTAIVIKNIAFQCKKEVLLELMASMQLPQPYAFNYHFDNGVFRGLCFANFSTSEAATAVIKQLNGLEVMGRKLRVENKKMLPQQERDRIEMEKRKRRGQLVETMPPLLHQTYPQHRADMSTQGSTGLSLWDIDLNNPDTLEFYTQLCLFRYDTTRNKITFQPTLSPEQRREVHVIAEHLNLDHTSLGCGDQRQVYVQKRTPLVALPISPEPSEAAKTLWRSSTQFLAVSPSVLQLRPL